MRQLLEESKNGIKTLYAKSAREWRKWLKNNHDKQKSIFLIIYHKQSNIPSVTRAEAVEEALCFGWIDAKAIRRDKESYYQTYAQRKPRSNWSKINKDLVDKLIREKRMTPAGLAKIELAKRNGSWKFLDKIEKLQLPKDFKDSISKNKKAWDFYKAFPPSSKKIILTWIDSAKRPETRSKRIAETIRLATKNERANHYKPKL
jgi:uncharacterized protein YdeI (YjbR/CyaY-like superfamily)